MQAATAPKPGHDEPVSALGDSDLLAAMSQLSLRSTFDPPEDAGGAEDLSTADGLSRFIDHYRRSLFGDDALADGGLDDAAQHEVAASIGFQAVVAHCATVSVLAPVHFNVGLEIQLGDMRWRPHGYGVRFGVLQVRRVDPPDTAAALDHVRVAVAEPLATLTREVADLPAALLAGNAEAAMWTARREVEPVAPLRRTTCCRIHLAGLRPCDECPLTPDATGTRP